MGFKEIVDGNYHESASDKPSELGGANPDALPGGALLEQFVQAPGVQHALAEIFKI